MRTTLLNAHLAAFDFDKTIARTFEPSPKGIGVNEAYELALQKLFGPKGLMQSVGGLRNRAPTELVQDILDVHPSLLARGMLTYEREYERLKSLMPRGKGIPLVPLRVGDVVELIGEVLVRLKLEILLNEIGSTWPRPYEGVLEFMDDLHQRDKATAIISSGHDPFIRRCFDVWGAACPRILLTDDDLRPRPDPIVKKTKPSRVLIDYVIMMAFMSGRTITSKDIVYFGDDIDKDGGLAANADVPFGHFCPEATEPHPRLGKDAFWLRSWHEARSALH